MKNLICLQRNDILEEKINKIYSNPCFRELELKFFLSHRSLCNTFFH